MNQRSSSKQRRPKTTRKKTVARKPLRRWLRTWKRARFKQRLAMILVPLVAVICVIALVVGLTTFVRWRREVDAATAAQDATAQRYGFNPGNIISDGQFFNEHAMSQAEVQAFLDQQGGALASMRFDTESHPADELCEAYEGATDESAAAVIDKSARACGISQKVLLTMLQKEQHLVTATAPTDFQIRAAMGLSCPDDANCDPAYAGFFNQVYGAARRYRYYLNHPDDYAYHAGRFNYVQYSPIPSCGGSQVYIENNATALLYVYTPYQPNQAALEAGTGEGDACSSYGNRNFSLIYTDWFNGYTGYSVDLVIPILCSVTLVCNFIFAFWRSRFTQNALVYMLLNIGVGVLPYLLLLFRVGTGRIDAHSIPWVICLIISAITCLGLIIFQGRALRCELEKRLHM